MMKRPSLKVCLLALLFAAPIIAQAENWKGHTQSPPFELGVMGGLSLYGSSVSWGLLGSAAYLVQPDGWVDDIDERVWAELQLGPTFFNQGGTSQTGMQYSGHLRWDFTLNQDWTFYALGGAGGFYLPTMLGGYMTIAPRFGVGAEFQTKVPMMFRMELSSNFIGGGVSFNF